MISSELAIGREWLAIRVKSNFEKCVSVSIRGKSIEEFLPTYVRGRNERTQSEIRGPLFPGYLFCRPDYQERLKVLKIPGVLGFVGSGKQAIPVLEEEICAIQKMLESCLPVWPCPFLRVGERIRLKEGPLCGLEGCVLSIKDSWQIVVSLTLLQRSVAVPVDPSWIAAAPRGCP